MDHQYREADNVRDDCHTRFGDDYPEDTRGTEEDERVTDQHQRPPNVPRGSQRTEFESEEEQLRHGHVQDHTNVGRHTRGECGDSRHRQDQYGDRAEHDSENATAGELCGCSRSVQCGEERKD
ncbi:hypothetical protein C493_07449 [Natronolimnohabitans innermongolicus JCM 12255]|uniref:Uncharacterized protein n=1 Tax=Natronolimnohabitans innermongolicus JCM 12255 TaxID=1227499 RepID=L9XAR3_9EURY|nr:hypothetical protein C493_07449 [Natronolimnohabitans innermongolicus JCM 12255]